jgi:hypothetical protein
MSNLPSISSILESGEALTSIRNTYLLVKLTFNKPQLQKTDRKAQRDAEDANGAHGSLKVLRSLWAKHTIDPFTTVENEARNYLRSESTSFGEYQLLHKKRFLKVQDVIVNTYFVQRDQLRVQFGQNYVDRLRDAAAAQGTLFDPTIYPDAQEIVSQFSQSFDVYPVGDMAASFFAGIEDDIAQEVASKVQETTVRTLQEAVKEPLARLLEIMMNVHNKASRENSRIHDSLMTELEEVTSLMPALNVLDVPMLNEMAAQCRKQFLVPIEALKDKASSTRAQVAEASSAWLDALGVDPQENKEVTSPTERRHASIAAAEKIFEQMRGF